MVKVLRLFLFILGTVSWWCWFFIKFLCESPFLNYWNYAAGGQTDSLWGCSWMTIKESRVAYKIITLFPCVNSTQSIWLANKSGHICREESSSNRSKMTAVSSNQTRHIAYCQWSPQHLLDTTSAGISWMITCGYTHHFCSD